MRAFLERKKLIIRNRNAIRPWQHVLEPLSGYLLLAQKLWENSSYCGAWNFGPTLNKEYTAHDVIQIAMQLWNRKVDIIYDSDLNPYEAEHLRLDSSKLVQKLGWVPKLSTWEAIDWTVQWYKNFQLGTNIKTFTVNQIKSYEIFKGSLKRMSNQTCRFCRSDLKHTFIDLGVSPLANSFIKEKDLCKKESFFLCMLMFVVNVCLVQIGEFESPEHIFNEYAYFSSFSDSWLAHAQKLC